MEDKKTLILKVLVGSHAHGLATPESDYDYRGVYVNSTSDILSLGYNYKGSHWLEGQEDQTTYEIGHFLMLATKCNPSILEVFKAPVKDFDGDFEKTFGLELRSLFPYVWNPKGVYDAFVGYGMNQRKKMLDNHLDRWNKYGVAYIRTLWNLCDLLETKNFTLEIKDPVLRIQLMEIKDKKLSHGQIIDLSNQLEKKAQRLLGSCENEPDYTKVNNFLLKVRKEFWS